MPTLVQRVGRSYHVLLQRGELGLPAEKFGSFYIQLFYTDGALTSYAHSNSDLERASEAVQTFLRSNEEQIGRTGDVTSIMPAQMSPTSALRLSSIVERSISRSPTSPLPAFNTGRIDSRPLRLPDRATLAIETANH